MRTAFDFLPFAIQRVKDLLDEVTISRGLLTDITLAPAVNLKARCQFAVSAVKLVFLGIGRQAVKFLQLAIYQLIPLKLLSCLRR
ncbi:hypothetical protein AO262_02205 [Pseudomonas fluorescens ABAC62]|nr:hypothetical protein AO262_02205 [Pseudomonas fluorescens ABAC62]